MLSIQSTQYKGEIQGNRELDLPANGIQPV